VAGTEREAGAVSAATGAAGAALGAAGVAFGATSNSVDGLIGAVAPGAAYRASKGVTVAPPTVAAWIGAGMGTERLCDRMPPNTARHRTMTSVPTIAASRMAKSPNRESS